MAGPAVSHIIARIGPMLNVMPRFDNVAEINQELYLPRPYPAPPGVVPLGPNNPGEPDDVTAMDKPSHPSKRAVARVAQDAKWTARASTERVLRHDAMYRVPAPASSDATH
jgi:hypothetical protein